MTTVNWERLEGGTVEEIVAALLLLGCPHGNRITPSRGDRGIDVQVYHPDGTIAVYQVKRYARPLTGRQAIDIEDSWHRFAGQALPSLPVRSWTLVMPWDPTQERLQWLHQLTGDKGIDVHWMGRATLDALAAQHPAVIDYYLGDGGKRIQELMRMALTGAAEIPVDAAGNGLLDAVADRHRVLADTLNTLDPFYRYELNIRAGHVNNEQWKFDTGAGQATFCRYTQLDENTMQVLRVLPRCPAANQLRPISATYLLEAEAGSAEQEAIDEFAMFGAPFHHLPAQLVHATGPCGVDAQPSRKLIDLTAPPPGPDFPELELRLITAQGDIVSTTELITVAANRSPDERGVWIGAHDRGEVLSFGLYLGGSGYDEIRLDSNPLAGKTPADMLPVLHLLAGLNAGHQVFLAVRGGPALSGTSSFFTDEMIAGYVSQHLPIAEALATVQRHTYQRVTYPDLAVVPSGELRALLNAAQLLDGKRLEGAWDSITLPVGSKALPVPADSDEYVLLIEEPGIINLGPQQIKLDVRLRRYHLCVRDVDPAAASTNHADASITLVPGATATALTVAVKAESLRTTDADAIALIMPAADVERLLATHG